MSRRSTRARSVASTTTPDVQQGAVVPNRQLRAIVEGIEKLEEDSSANRARIREKYKEAEGKGYNVKALRKVMRERRQDPTERAEIDIAMKAYRVELGMVAHAVRNGEMSVRQAEEVSGFSRSAIHREVSHRKEVPVSVTADAPTATAGAANEVSHTKEVPVSGTPATAQADVEDDLAYPASSSTSGPRLEQRRHDWGPDNAEVVLRAYGSVAVHENGYGDIVIRQERDHPMEENDRCVAVPRRTLSRSHKPSSTRCAKSKPEWQAMISPSGTATSCAGREEPAGCVQGRREGR